MGQIIKVEFEGKEQEFEALPAFRANERTHHFIQGDIKSCGTGHNDTMCLQSLRLIRKRHTFGSLIYEETGERRCRVEPGEPYLSYSCDEGMVVCRKEAFCLASPVVILKVVDR